jgi:hypothetical protein
VVTASSVTEGRAPRVLSAIAFVAVTVIDALYLGIVSSQGGTPPSRYVVPFIASYLAAIALMLLVSLLSPAGIKAAFRGAAAGGLLVFGALSALTIGAVVMIAALLSVGAAILTVARVPGRFTLPAAVVGAVVAVVILLTGLQLAWSQTTG